jgi:hypothetical protein
MNPTLLGDALFAHTQLLIAALERGDDQALPALTAERGRLLEALADALTPGTALPAALAGALQEQDVSVRRAATVLSEAIARELSAVHRSQRTGTAYAQTTHGIREPAFVDRRS